MTEHQTDRHFCSSSQAFMYMLDRVFTESMIRAGTEETIDPLRFLEIQQLADDLRLQYKEDPHACTRNLRRFIVNMMTRLNAKYGKRNEEVYNKNTFLSEACAKCDVDNVGEDTTDQVNRLLAILMQGHVLEIAPAAVFYTTTPND